MGRSGAPPTYMTRLMVHQNQRLLLGFAVSCAIVAGCADDITANLVGLAHLLPVLLAFLPLLTGRYIGEERLARLARSPSARPCPRAASTHPSGRPARAVPRGGCLIASFLAVRPPPLCGPAAIAADRARSPGANARH